jgi:hypothetical protein
MVYCCGHRRHVPNALLLGRMRHTVSAPEKDHDGAVGTLGNR